MSVSVHSSERSRHLVVRVSAGETLPDALATKLQEEQVACGWLRASGVLADVELRAFDVELGTLGSTRRIAGPVHVLALEGSIGLVDGEPSFSLRALLARETDRGLETLAGEIASARTVALEALVTVLDDVTLERALDAGAGVWLLGSATASSGPARAAKPTAPVLLRRGPRRSRRANRPRLAPRAIAPPAHPRPHCRLPCPSVPRVRRWKTSIPPFPSQGTRSSTSRSAAATS